MKKYQVVKENDGRYTIGEYDEGYKAFIINDGIYGYYHWDNEAAAQEAAKAYNEYQGNEWLGQHGYGNDVIREGDMDDADPDMIELYRLFDAVEEEKYFITCGTGAGDEWVTGSLEDAKARADEQATYCQSDIVIEDEDGYEVTRRVWYGYTPDSEDRECDIIEFGDFGFYNTWSDEQD